MERISVYIDGGNFYHLVIKKLDIEENDFDFDVFANLLIDGRTASESCKRFYKGSVREKEGDLCSKQLMSKQTKLFTTLKKSGWDIKTSKLRTRVEELIVDSRVFEYKKLKKIGLKTIHTERMREKGIDVKIATDLLVGAFDNKYDTAIVVSSDSDLVPAIDWVRNRMKKKIEYIGFSIPDLKDPKKSTRPLMMMFSKTDVQRVFSDIEMSKFIKSPENKLNCIIIHGCPSLKEKSMSPETRTYDKHWIPWIKKELLLKGIKTKTPLMPNPWEPDYEAFKKEFEKYPVSENTILIGHSCGCAFLVRWLGESKQKIKKLILVAPWKIPDKDDSFREQFYVYPIDETINSRVGEIVMFTADNEREDGKKSVEIYKKTLNSKIIELKGKGHYIFKDMGTEELPELLEEID